MKTRLKLLTVVFVIFSVCFFAIGACAEEKSLTIYFETNGAEAIDPIIYKDNSFELPANPTKTGYTFDGWYFDNNTFLEKLTVTSIMRAQTISIKVYAKWIKEATSSSQFFTVVFNSLGGSSVPAKSEIASDSQISAPVSPTRSGYAFGGWYKDQECVYPWNFQIDTVTTNLTLYARWVYDTYEVIFLTNGGSEVETLTTNYNGVIKRPNDPVREYYTFMGWYSDANFTQEFDFANTRITQLKNYVYAKWRENTWQVRFDSLGGSEVNALQKLPENVKITLPEPPVRKGYIFKGWGKELDTTVPTELNGKTPWSESTDILNEEVTILYAIWEVGTYRLTYNKNTTAVITGDMGQRSIKFNEKIQLEPNEFVRRGYTFQGWSTTPDGELEYEDCAFIRIIEDHNIELFAVWQANEYNIHYAPNGGTGNIPSVKVCYDEEISLPLNLFSYAGYTFSGWKADSESSIRAEESKYTMLSIVDVTFTAQWTPITYYVKFDLNGAKGEMPDLGIPFETSKQLPDCEIEYEGYDFGGWSTESGGSAVYCIGGENVTFTMSLPANKTLYAVWVAKDCIVTFMLNSESEISCSQVFKYDIMQPLKTIAEIQAEKPNFRKTGHSFAGWSYSVALEDNTLTYSFADGVDFNVTNLNGIVLYAIWTPNTYRILFNANGGEGSMNQHYMVFNTTVGQPLPQNQFSRTGYSFAYWAKTNDIDSTDIGEQPNERYLDGADYIMDTDYENPPITLYAVWTPNKYIVTFDLNGGSQRVEGSFGLAKEVIFDRTATIQKVFTAQPSTYALKRDGYDFVGWSTIPTGAAVYIEPQNEPISFRVDISANFTLYAVWTPAFITIKYDRNEIGARTALNPHSVTISPVENMSDSQIRFTESGVLSANTYILRGGTDSTVKGRFIGWSDTPTGTVKFADRAVFTMSQFTTVTLYAVWEIQKEAVYFEGNGGATAQGITSISEMIGSGGTITVKENPFIRTSYDFLKWATNADGTGEFYLPGQGIENITETITLYAIWREQTTTIIYNKGVLPNATGTMANQTATINKNVTLRANTYAIQAYTFVGWTTIQNDMVHQYTNGQTIFLSPSNFNLTQKTDGTFGQGTSDLGPGTLTLYAVWEEGTSGLSYTLSNGSYVVSIGSATSASYIYIPDMYRGLYVTAIASDGFKNATALQTIRIPQYLASIGANAFRGCTALRTIVGLAESEVGTIGSSAFYGCTALTSIELPYAFSTIQSNLFYGCTSLSSVIASNITSIGSSAFQNCTSLFTASFTSLSSLTSIGNSAFESSGLKSVTIGYNVTSLGSRAFANCSGLTSMSLQSYGTTIANSNVLLGHNTALVIHTSNAHSAQIFIDSAGWYSYAPRFYYFYSLSMVVSGGSANYCSAVGRNSGNYLRFIPAVSRSYTIYSTGSADTYLYVYDSSYSLITYNDDSGSGLNFSITRTFYANTVYYLQVGFYSSSASGTITFYIV